MKTRTPEQKAAWEEIVIRTSFEGWDFDEKNVETVQDLYNKVDPISSRKNTKASNVRILSKDSQKQVIKLYKNGVSPKGLARQFGVSRTTIHEVLKGVTSPAQEQRIQERENRDKVIQSLNEKGYKQARIGELTGVSAATVGKVIRGVR